VGSCRAKEFGRESPPGFAPRHAHAIQSFVHRRSRVFHDGPVPAGEAVGGELAQGPGGGDSGRRMPGTDEGRQRKAQDELAAHEDLPNGEVGVATDQRSIPAVVERNLPWGVPRRGDDFQRAGHVAGLKQVIGLAVESAIDDSAQPPLGLRRVECEVPGTEAGLAGTDEQLSLRQRLYEFVKRSDVIPVCVRDRDPPDRSADAPGSRQNRGR
jgi:hypothetical protein